ncbi:DUF945 family protein [Salinicola rhizosphaerae]|uniref:DUF945 domain-containing protein n=1 Tax=Salinicola rhizosphaerae TaxID=1443141 RepID=A0ABQ3E546_9GAMM|nr:DUF945 family protein [Salinicola rhizosphaerae]GHB25200.1 hypothetical protein GCM10009038_25360 [Salinicola rhizosphaerae]
MRKAVVAGVVVIVVAGAGYLGAQAYSSQRFDDEVGKLVARMDASPAWNVKRDQIDAGWFHSSGRIMATYRDAPPDQPVVIEMPYQADHGLLETKLAGEGQVKVGDDTLFGDLLQSQQSLRWSGRFLTREQKLEAKVEVPSISQQVSVPASEIDGEMIPARDLQVDFGGLTLDITQHEDSLTLNGTSPMLHLADDQADVRLENLGLEGQFQGDEQAFEQSLTLTLPTTTVTPNGSPDVVTQDVSYALRAKLDADAFDAHFDADLGETRLQNQTLLKGGMSMTLDHVDGDAYRALASGLDAHWPAIQSALDAEDDNALAQALTPVQPAIHDILAGSPQLSLDRLQADSALLGMQMTGKGRLAFDGEQLPAWGPQALDRVSTTRDLIRRMQGQLTLTGAPPLLALALGLPLANGPLQVGLDDGVLTVNGQPMPLLPPASP